MSDSEIFEIHPQIKTSGHRGRTIPQTPNVTGRDAFIIAEALLRFIVTEQQKPRHLQQWSNLQDAIAIFNARVDAVTACGLALMYPDTKVSLIDEKTHFECFE